MARKHVWLPKLLGALLLSALAVATLAADDSTQPTPKEPPDPPGTAPYMTQLRALFDAWDLNGDGYLDKEELAKAFRGPNAKPFDYDPKAARSSESKPADPKDAGKDPSVKDPNVKDPTVKDPTVKDPSVKDAGNSGTSGGTSSDKKPDYTRFPDYNFLIALDTDGDGKISRSEFMSWSRDYATQLKQKADQIQKLAQLQTKLASTAAKPNSKEYQQLAAQVKKEEAAMKKLATAVQAYEKQVEQANNKKPKK